MGRKRAWAVERSKHACTEELPGPAAAAEMDGQGGMQVGRGLGEHALAQRLAVPATGVTRRPIVGLQWWGSEEGAPFGAGTRAGESKAALRWMGARGGMGAWWSV